MLTFDYCESVGAVPQRLENLTQLQSIFQRKDVAQTIAKLRATEDKDERARLKKHLPAVCWQATFSGQKRHNTNATPSGLFMLDIDHVDDVQKMWKEQIEPNLEAQKICFVHISPSGEGLRVVARCLDTSSIAQQQERLAKALGVPFDAVCKDMARLSFVSRSDEILYINAELFEEEGLIMVEKAPLPSPRKGGSLCESRRVESLPPHGGTEGGLYYQGCNLQDFVEAWLASRGGIPEVGARNHTFYALGRDLRYLCDFDKQMMSRCVSDEMLNGYPRAELLQTFEGACQSTRRASFPPEVTQILGTLQGEVDTVDGLEEKTVEKLPPLPYMVDAFVGIAPKDFKAPTILAMLPVLGTLCTHLRAEYLDGEMHSPSFMTVIEAEQASGKSFTRKIVEVLLEGLREQDNVAREEEKAYLQALKLNKNRQEQPQDPKAKVRIIPASVSVAKLLQRLDYAQGEHIFSYCEEIDTLYKSNKSGAWAQKSDLYRNAFDNAEYGQDYMSDNSYSTIVKVFYNLLLCGTPKAVTRFFPDCEDGLVSRVIFCKLPDQFAAQFPKFSKLHSQTIKKLQSLSKKIVEEKEDHVMDCGFLNRRMERWLEAKRVESLKTLNKAEDQFRRRAAVIGFRAGMVAHYINGEKATVAAQKLASSFAIWVANFVLQQQLDRFADQVNTEVVYKQRQVNCVKVFDRLPESFTRNEVIVFLKKHHYRQPAKVAIYQWKREGLIEKAGEDTYRKITNKVEAKDENHTNNENNGTENNGTEEPEPESGG